MSKPDNKPAFPFVHRYPNGEFYHGDGGMTLREYAAIHLRVPQSGSDWLDEMIEQSLRNDLAAKAMQGNLASMVEGQEFDPSMGAEWAHKVANAMLKASKS
jgi:hypothetical protein